MNDLFRKGVALAVICGVAALAVLRAEPQEPKKEPSKTEGKVETNAAAKPMPMPEWATTAIKPKALSGNAGKGLAYLVNQQHANGGWGQGGGWRTADKAAGRVEGKEVEDPPDVASTCMATLALLRAGNTPKEGQYAKNVVKAIEFICTHVEKADKESMHITDIRGTQVQSKIGPYVDTFLAALILAEAKGRMPDEKADKRVLAALDKTIGKIERNQREDGLFAGNEGWASIISQGLCSKGLNRARQAGAMVREETLAKADKAALAGLDVKGGKFASSGAGGAGLAGAGRGAGGPSDAGVDLYGVASKTSALQERANTNKELEKKARETLQKPGASKDEKEKAERDLKTVAEINEATKAATKAVTDRLEDKQFIQGFGSNGGEEFLSYMNISETLLVKGGPEWEKWDKSVTDNMNRIQNQDGSWSGHHCITGRTFCTASALLVLMADRTPIPVAAKDAAKDKK